MSNALTVLMAAKVVAAAGDESTRIAMLDELIDLAYVRSSSRTHMRRIALMPPQWPYWMNRARNGNMDGCRSGEIRLWRWPSYRPLEWR